MHLFDLFINIADTLVCVVSDGGWIVKVVEGTGHIQFAIQVFSWGNWKKLKKSPDRVKPFWFLCFFAQRIKSVGSTF
jgi:hypothetical protein